MPLELDALSEIRIVFKFELGLARNYCYGVW